MHHQKGAFMRLVGFVAIAASILCSALPAGAYTITNEAAIHTTTAGATEFATFDASTDTSVATISGGTVCPPPGGCDGSTNPTTSPATAYLYMRSGVLDEATITFNALQDYFGLVWGTPDGFNMAFFNGSTPLTVFGSTGFADNNAFTNFTAADNTEFFNKITLTGNGCCFEVDNFAARAAPAVPEPSPLALLATGLGLSVFYVRRRFSGSDVRLAQTTVSALARVQVTAG